MKSVLSVLSIGIVALGLTFSAAAAKKPAATPAVDSAILKECTAVMFEQFDGRITRKEAADYCACYAPAIIKIANDNPEKLKTERHRQQLAPQMERAAMACAKKTLNL